MQYRPCPPVQTRKLGCRVKASSGSGEVCKVRIMRLQRNRALPNDDEWYVRGAKFDGLESPVLCMCARWAVAAGSSTVR